WPCRLAHKNLSSTRRIPRPCRIEGALNFNVRHRHHPAAINRTGTLRRTLRARTLWNCIALKKGGPHQPWPSFGCKADVQSGVGGAVIFRGWQMQKTLDALRILRIIRALAPDVK